MHSIPNVSVATNASYDLTTVDVVNRELRLTSNTANDAIVADQITAASRIIADICNRVFALANVVEIFRTDYYWSEHPKILRLSQWPVAEVANVTCDENLIDPASYELNGDNGLLYRVDWGAWHYFRKVVVNYASGYNLPDEAPPILAQACVQLIREFRFAQTRPDSNVRDLTHGDTRVSYFANPTTAAATAGVPATVQSLIAPYKRLDN